MSDRESAEARLRAAIRHHDAVCRLVTAAHRITEPSGMDAVLIDRARQSVVTCMDACNASGATDADLDAICAEETRA